MCRSVGLGMWFYVSFGHKRGGNNLNIRICNMEPRSSRGSIMKNFNIIILVYSKWRSIVEQHCVPQSLRSIRGPIMKRFNISLLVCSRSRRMVEQHCMSLFLWRVVVMQAFSLVLRCAKNIFWWSLWDKPINNFPRSFFSLFALSFLWVINELKLLYIDVCKVCITYWM